MNCYVSSGTLNPTHSLTHCRYSDKSCNSKWSVLVHMYVCVCVHSLTSVSFYFFFLCCDYMWNKIISKSFRSLSTSDWNTEIILFQRVETAWNYFTGLLQLMDIFQHAHCRWNNYETILELLQCLKLFYFSFRRVKWNTEIILKLFQCFISRVTSCSGYMWNKRSKQFQNYFHIILSHL